MKIITQTKSEVKEQALRFARMGFKVFPTAWPIFNGGEVSCSCGKVLDPTSKHKTIKHPLFSSSWLKISSNDQSQIETWWDEFPDAGLAIDCGGSGLLVIDFDVNKPGYAGDKLLAKLRRDGPTFEVATGGGGTHLYYKQPESKLGNKKGSLPEGVDVRGLGGYVVAPPSIHQSGLPYVIESDCDIAKIPTFLLTMLDSKPEPDPEPEQKPATKAQTKPSGWILGMANKASNGAKIRSLVEHVPPQGGRSEAFIDVCNLLAFYAESPEHLRTELMETPWASYMEEKPQDKAPEKAFAGRTSSYWDGAREPEILSSVVEMDEALGEALVNSGDHDLGNAEAVLILYPNQIKYTTATGWMVWTGTHWEPNSTGTVRQMVKTTLVKKRAAAALRSADKGYEMTIRESKPTRYHIEGALSLLWPEVESKFEAFDAEPHLLNCRNGVVNLKTGELSPHNPSQLFTYCLGTDYVPGARSLEWENFLLQAVGSTEMVDYLQLVVGYSFTGDTREERMFYVHGPTRSGKGTFSETLLTLMGRPLGVQADFGTFTAKREGDSQNFDLAGLKPSRLVIASESNAGEYLNEAKVKTLTGGDWIRAAHKHKDFFEYRPQFKIFLVSNQPPKGNVDDDALWYRIDTINFPNSHAESEDKELKFRLRSRANLEGILAWVVEGAQKWYREGLSRPQVVRDATQAARDELDTVKQWLDECCVNDPGSWEPNSKLYGAYELWCESNGASPLRKNRFGHSMGAKGYKPSSSRVGARVERGWNGLLLTDENL